MEELLKLRKRVEVLQKANREFHSERPESNRIYADGADMAYTMVINTIDAQLKGLEKKHDG